MLVAIRSPSWFRNFDLTFQEKNRNLHTKFMLQFLARNETNLFSSFFFSFLTGRYEDQYIIRFYKDKLHSMPCQNQVSFFFVIEALF